MSQLKELLEKNKQWSASVREQQPGFFEELAHGQTPKYLWIGCSDSRVPATQITGQMPGDLFVHRNIANQVIHTDLNSLSVLQFAVEYLKVEHIVVCGHYGCGGVMAACQSQELGLIDNWLRHIKDVRTKHADKLTALEGDELYNKMCELNVIEQVVNVCKSTFVQDAWSQEKTLSVHSCIYDLKDGLLMDLELTVTAPDSLDELYKTALSRLLR